MRWLDNIRQSLRGYALVMLAIIVFLILLGLLSRPSAPAHASPTPQPCPAHYHMLPDHTCEPN